MGETEEGANQLDQQIWGSDDEDPNENEEGKLYISYGSYI